jgi:hypothetical protein
MIISIFSLDIISATGARARARGYHYPKTAPAKPKQDLTIRSDCSRQTPKTIRKTPMKIIEADQKYTPNNQ